MALVFNAEDHTYVMDGTNLPSVTTVLGQTGIIDKRWYTKSGTDRGSKVHQMLEFYDEGELVETGLDDQLLPYLEAWKKLLQDTNLKILEVEKKVHHPKHMYAGTIDRVALINGEMCILELKTGKPSKWHPLQTAPYQQCMKERTGGALMRRIAVYLTPKGTYRLQDHPNDVEDFAVFYSALRVYRWIYENGGKRK